MNSLLARFWLRSPLIASMFALFSFVSVANAQNADLVVTKFTDSTIVAADTDVSYDISVSNFSGQSSTGPNVLTDNVPTNMTFVSATVPDGWDCAPLPAVGSGGTITCTFSGDIGDEASFLFTFVFHVNPGVPNDTVITNTANISHAGSDPNSGNNMASANVTVGDPPPPPPPPVQARDVLISEFRLSGPGGDSDEYIEFYCNRDANCDISGFSIRTYDPNLGGDFSATFPPNSVIPARQFALLATNLTQYSLASYAFPDFIVSDMGRPDFFIDNEGIKLVDGEGVPIDSVGFAGGGNDFDYVEGTGLQPSGGIAPARPPDHYAYVRKRGTETNGRSQDTNNNAEDFVLVSVTGDFHPGIDTPPVLGAPGPKGLTSQLTYSNSQVTSSLVEPLNASQVTPNQVRDLNGGTLSIRRSFTNNTGQFLDFIRFRVIVITTKNSPNTVGEAQAELRLVTSGEAETFENTQGRTVVIRGSVLEWDPNCGCEPQQPNGGGLNSSVFYDNEGSIEPGETIDVQFLLNVVTPGAFRFYVYVEAFPSQGIGQPNPQKSTRGGPRGVGEPRKLVDLRFLPRSIVPPRKQPKPGTRVPKSATPAIAPPTMSPLRAFIIVHRPETNAKAKKRKVRVRRKASAALREKVKANDEQQKISQY